MSERIPEDVRDEDLEGEGASAKARWDDVGDVGGGGRDGDPEEDLGQRDQQRGGVVLVVEQDGDHESSGQDSA